ncbi:hypothetical protein MKW98_016233 [Papaver atlanticum]|uniref:BED-type domain-containing protein n=1 Tax=Papaver atlanticum TaxID=357466 RepID=A0AAD4XEJ2_9MAGN|nr:hypothetical protein MKW98_016233 [Papaver atlanticum]
MNTSNATPTTSTTQQTEVGSSSQAASHTNEVETATPTSLAEAVEVGDGDSKKKHGKVRSEIWLEMTRINETQAECHHCHRTYAAHNDVNDTYGLRKHLNRCPRNLNKGRNGRLVAFF